MAFQTGIATSLNNFFTQLRSFAAANVGFSNQGTTIINGNTVHHLSKGGIYWNFEETLTTVTSGFTSHYSRMRMTYTKPIDVDGFNQSFPTGQERFTAFGTFANSGPYTSHIFYTEGTAVHAVLEVFPGIFQHLSFGSITKFGTWTGGEYLTAGSYQGISSSTRTFSSSNSSIPFADTEGSGHNSGTSAGFNQSCQGYMRYLQTGSNGDDFAPIGSITLNNQRVRMGSLFAPKATQDVNMFSSLLFDSPNQGNLRTALFPMYTRVRDYDANIPATLDAYFIGGVVPGVRLCNVSNLNPKEIVNTNWQVYPMVQKFGDSDIAPISGDVGLAYERIA